MRSSLCISLLVSLGRRRYTTEFRFFRVDSLNVRDDTEIDWKTISDPQWNLWSAHTLQRRWLTMKRSIKGHEDMTHQGTLLIFIVKPSLLYPYYTPKQTEIMDILRVKKAQVPPTSAVSTRKRKERKVTSAAAIADSDLQRDAVSIIQAEAGSSTGPGTVDYGVSVGAGSGEGGQRQSQDKDADGSTDMDE
jgi:hypothetical protein